MVDIFREICRVYRFISSSGVNAMQVTCHWHGRHVADINTLSRDKMDANFLTSVSNAFSWRKIFIIRLRFHWILCPRVQLITFQHWFRWLLHYLNQWWLFYWRIYASLGLSKVKRWRLSTNSLLTKVEKFPMENNLMHIVKKGAFKKTYLGINWPVQTILPPPVHSQILIWNSKE